MATHNALMQDLIHFDTLKVWSVLVTIFGDLAPGPNDTVRGPELSALTSRMAIKPEALRVAIHRLRNDGWIASEKSGRVSYYRLSPVGRLETETARERVYGSHLSISADWHAVLTERDRDDATSQGWLHVREGFYLVNHRPVPSKGDLVTQITGTTLPDWIIDAICAPPVQAKYQEFIAILDKVQNASVPACSLDRVALRLLVLHAWRRLVLRNDLYALGDLAPAWFSDQTLAVVQATLASLPRDTTTISGPEDRVSAQ